MLLHRQIKQGKDEAKKNYNLKLKGKLVKKVFATRQLNGKKANVFSMARKLNPSAKVECRYSAI